MFCFFNTVQMYDQRSQPSADSYVHGASIGGPRRDDLLYSGVNHRDTSPPSNYRTSVDRNTTQYNNNPPSSTHPASYTPHVASHSHAIANPLPTLSSRTSKWSAGLVDPLDIYDKLLHNSLCIYEESSSSAHATNQPNVAHRADIREDRHISTTIPTTSTGRYGNYSLSPTNTSRKRAISPTNSLASDHNYYSSGDNRYPTHCADRSTRPRAEYSDIRKNDSRDSRDRSNRFSDRDHDQSRNRRSRSSSRTRFVPTRDDKHSNSHPFRSTERIENRSVASKNTTEQKHGDVNTASTTTTINRLQSMHTKNKPDYALTAPSQLCAMYRTPSVSLHYIQYPTILHVQDLCVKYPRLYVPNDFLRVTLDTHSMLHALDSNFIAKIVEPVSAI